MIVEYGMLSEDKFMDKAKDFNLFPNHDESTFYTYDEFIAQWGEAQKDKNGKTVVLYASDAVAQFSYIQSAKNRGYEVILLDSPLSSHFIQKLEQTYTDVVFKRVDAASLDELIEKEDATTSLLDEDQQKTLKEVVEKQVETPKFIVEVKAMSASEAPFLITLPEFMRRMKEMNQMGGGGMMSFGDLPESYNLVVNANHPISSRILEESDEAKRTDMIKKGHQLALLSQNLLKGEALNDFVSKGFGEL